MNAKEVEKKERELAEGRAAASYMNQEHIASQPEIDEPLHRTPALEEICSKCERQHQSA